MAEFIEPYDPNLILIAAAIGLAILLASAALAAAFMSRQAPMKRSLLFGLLVLLILLLPAFLAVILIGEIDWTSKFAAESATTTGEVIDFVVYEDSEGDEVSAAVVRFTTPDGQTATVEDSTRCMPPCYTLGDQLSVRYRTTDPSDAIVSEGSNLWRGAVVNAVMVAVFLVLSPLLIHEAYKRLKPRSVSPAP